MSNEDPSILLSLYGCVHTHAHIRSEDLFKSSFLLALPPVPRFAVILCRRAKPCFIRSISFTFRFSQYVSGQRVLIAGAITSALRLHQRVPQLRPNRQTLAQILAEDSAHYLLYSALMLWTTQPVSGVCIQLAVSQYKRKHCTV